MRFAGTAGILWRGSWLLRVKKNLFSINQKNLILFHWLKRGFWFVPIMQNGSGTISEKTKQAT